MLETILVAEDDTVTWLVLQAHLESWGYRCIRASDGIEALHLLEENNVDLIISDQVMPRMDGTGLLAEVKKRDADIPFVLLTAFATVKGAVKSLKTGADDYIEKPFEPEDLQKNIRRLLDMRDLRRKNKALQCQLDELYSFHNIVTRSQAMMRTLDMAKKVASAPDTTVAIFGESGTGKEVMARAIHFASARSAGRLVVVNCAAVPKDLIESELFGHAKGAFTGADTERVGKFELAHDGTLFLDEIGDMPLELQSKLLRVLEEKAFERVGSNRRIEVNVRVITSTHKDIPAMVREGRFRSDLFHRINAFPLTLPHLRERKEDIPLLISHFLDMFQKNLGKALPGISQAAVDALVDYGWPGNIRELKNCIERAAILISSEPMIEAKHVLPDREALPAKKGLDGGHISICFNADEFTMENITNKALEKALEKCDNNKTQAAKLLGVDRKMFYRSNPK